MICASADYTLIRLGTETQLKWSHEDNTLTTRKNSMDHDFEPYDMLVEIAQALQWQTNSLESITKNHAKMDENVLGLYREFARMNLRIAELERRLNETQQTTTNDRPKR